MQLSLSLSLIFVTINSRQSISCNSSINVIYNSQHCPNYRSTFSLFTFSLFYRLPPWNFSETGRLKPPLYPKCPPLSSEAIKPIMTDNLRDRVLFFFFLSLSLLVSSLLFSLLGAVLLFLFCLVSLFYSLLFFLLVFFSLSIFLSVSLSHYFFLIMVCFDL